MRMSIHPSQTQGFCRLKIMKRQILLILYYSVQLDFIVSYVTLFPTVIQAVQITTITQNLGKHVRCPQFTSCFYLTKHSASILMLGFFVVENSRMNILHSLFLLKNNGIMELWNRREERVRKYIW